MTLWLLAPHCIFATDAPPPSEKTAGLVSFFQEHDLSPAIIQEALGYYQRLKEAAILAQVQAELDPYSLQASVVGAHGGRGALPMHRLLNLPPEELAAKMQLLRDGLRAAVLPDAVRPDGITKIQPQIFYHSWMNALREIDF